MSELRLTGKNEDGTHLIFADGQGNEFTARISDTLRATVNQPRLTSVPTGNEPEVITVKEIQRRLRAGESPESIAREGQTSVDKVDRFSGPILQERVYILDRARDVLIRKDSARTAETFGESVINKLAPRGVDTDQLSWDTWRLPDSSWHIQLQYPNRDGRGTGSWNFDLTRRSLTSSDENGAWLIGDDAPIRTPEPALIYSEASHPSRAQTPEQLRENPVSEVPRLAVIRDTPADEDTKDGITGRAKVPSWDEIMFGIKPESSED